MFCDKHGTADGCPDCTSEGWMDLLDEYREHIRKIWDALDQAPAVGFITQDLRDAICGAAATLSPTPWEDKERRRYDKEQEAR